MADESVRQNLSTNPDPQEKRVVGDDITPSQEQQSLPDRLSKSLIEWLARSKPLTISCKVPSPPPLTICV